VQRHLSLPVHDQLLSMAVWQTGCLQTLIVCLQESWTFCLCFVSVSIASVHGQVLYTGFLPHENQRICCMQDHSLRLWNLETQVCVCTMVGDGAHTNEVLSVVRPYLIIIDITDH